MFPDHTFGKRSTLPERRRRLPARDTMTRSVSPPLPARHAALDALRGLAFLAMLVYHACWFADDRGLLTLEFSSLPWRGFQKLIAGTFFLLVGVGLWLAREVPLRRSGWRLLRVGGGALIVTTASVVLDPARIVSFGVLHAIFVTSALGLLLRSAGARLLIPGLLLLLVGVNYHNARFDHPLLQWTGLGTVIPVTFDHQPFVVWWGVVLCGLALAARFPVPELPAPRPLVLLRQHSLFLYLAHVPALQVLMEVLVRLR